jgi:Tfp pilus assembly pilus retraction ATPase PilT
MGFLKILHEFNEITDKETVYRALKKAETGIK